MRSLGYAATNSTAFSSSMLYPVAITARLASLSAAPVKPEKVTTSSKPPKVEQEERNGVKRPNAGGACAAVWAWLDANPTATLKEAKAAAPAHGWNANNVSCEFYARRKFLGISKTTAPN